MITANEFEKYFHMVQESANKLELPEGVNPSEMDFNYEKGWHEWRLKNQTETGSFSLHFGGAIDDKNHKVLSGELRYFTTPNSKGQYRSMLFLTYGKIFFGKHFHLDRFDKSDERFIGADDKATLIEKSIHKMNEFISLMLKEDVSEFENA